MTVPLEVFCCYAHEDQKLLERLKNHLMPLQRSGQITIWSDTNLSAGIEWKKELHRHLESADIILLLVSADFFASDYCYRVEMQRALERKAEGSAWVIPILVRPTDWTDAPFAHLQALPTGAIPITLWSNTDTALAEVAAGIHRVIATVSTLTRNPPHLHNPSGGNSPALHTQAPLSLTSLPAQTVPLMPQMGWFGDGWPSAPGTSPAPSTQASLASTPSLSQTATSKSPVPSILQAGLPPSVLPNPGIGWSGTGWPSVPTTPSIPALALPPVSGPTSGQRTIAIIVLSLLVLFGSLALLISYQSFRAQTTSPTAISNTQSTTATQAAENQAASSTATQAAEGQAASSTATSEAQSTVTARTQAPPDNATISLSLSGTAQDAHTGATWSFSFTLNIQNGTACLPRDDGQRHTSHGKMNGGSGPGFTEIHIYSCVGNYHNGHFTYTETATSSATLDTGVTCHLQGTYVSAYISGTFSDYYNASGSYHSDHYSDNCSDGTYFSYAAEDGSWTSTSVQ